MVSYRSTNRVAHAQFRDLADYLNPGDVLVINTSGTLNAALTTTRADGTPLELHLSTHLPVDLPLALRLPAGQTTGWVVEVRQPNGKTTSPFYYAQAGETLTLPGGGKAILHTPYQPSLRDIPEPVSTRLWIATLHLPVPLQEYLTCHGFPIRYDYVRESWPISYYQTVYATEMGSAEMPSAGRAFTPELIMRLVARGVQVAPLLLHTGVASLEDHEPPYEEFYRVPPETAQAVNNARANGYRVIAVGTTVIRALETVTALDGRAHPGEGWTRLIITPQRGLRLVSGLLTGLHEPRSTHLLMLEALAGLEHLNVAYAEALHARYLWHEFGDLHLILP
jgi:S-adenosylmethionine:tRNA ribosyltransferase-isomerase